MKIVILSFHKLNYKLILVFQKYIYIEINNLVNKKGAQLFKVTAVLTLCIFTFWE